MAYCKLRYIKQKDNLLRPNRGSQIKTNISGICEISFVNNSENKKKLKYIGCLKIKEVDYFKGTTIAPTFT